MNSMQQREYDVIIMGAGFAGLCQTRHLLLNIPNIKIALIDPRPEERTEKDLKLGESTVEIAALFIGKELGLYEYLVENHPPKFGLNFHWPKDQEKTASIEDYYHVWDNRQPPMASTQLNRAKFERDLLKMNKEMGVSFYNGRVIDVELTPGDALKTVKVKLGSESTDLKAKHVVDAAGRRFIIGRKTDNLLFGPENLCGVNTGSAWVRVKNVDRSIFHDGFDPLGASTSHYYATNHWFGHGHWLWMIPTDTQSMELSIGVVQHHDVIPAESINTKDKFYAFLKANHNILYKLVTSSENIDFHYWPRLAHTSKMMFSPDNWYVIGDAACIFDAFYSMGSSMATFAIESVTEIIRTKLAGEANAEAKRSAYNEFNLTFTRLINTLMHGHTQQLGNASIMSWRIYFEYMLWFGMMVPTYVGKWHLDLEFVPEFVKTYQKVFVGLLDDLYSQLGQLATRKANIGLMDCFRADQLLWGYHTLKHFDNFLENAKYEPKMCNVFASMKHTFFYVAIWYAKLQWKAGGLSGVLAPQTLYHIFQLLTSASSTALGELVYWFRIKNLPTNSQVAKMRQEFQSYQYRPVLQPWIKDLAEPHSTGEDMPCAQEELTSHQVLSHSL